MYKDLWWFPFIRASFEAEVALPQIRDQLTSLLDGVNMQGEQLVTRLYDSFSDLERAIDSARDTLKSKDGVSEEIFRRLDTYEEIIARQKGLAEELRQHIDTGNIEEVTRHVIIINSLSAMIIEDAKEILTSLGGDVYVDELLESKDKIC